MSLRTSLILSMPTLSHFQSSKYGKNSEYPPQREMVQQIPAPIDTKAKVQKTKADADGWRPMTKWSRSTSYPGIPPGSVGIYGTGEVILHYAPWQLYVKNTNTLFYVRKLKNIGWPSQANVKNAAISKLKNQQLNVVMLLKDRRQTLQGLDNRLRTLIKSVNYARKGQLIRSARQLRKWWGSRTPGIVNRYRAVNDKVGKPLANMWLELNFLHMQVIADANGIIAELSREAPVGFLHGRSGLVNESTETVYAGSMSWNHIGGMDVTLKQERIVYAQISALPDMDWLTSASRLGITNVPYVLWDSIPLSFVLDWVLPVGQYLNGFDAVIGMKFKGGHIGLISKTTFRGAITVPPKGYSLTGSYAANVIAPNGFERILTDQFPDLPSFRNPLSGLAWKVATTAALLAGAVGSSQQKPR